MARNAALTLLFIGFMQQLAGSPCLAQSGLPGGSRSAPIVGSTGGLSVPSNKFDMSSKPKQHQTPAGKACVTIHGFSNRQIVNPDMFENILIIGNECSKAIGLSLCYLQSEKCISTTIGPYGRRQQVLGLQPSKDFRFAYTEVFN